MKLWTSEHIIDHPWDTVTHAALRKYPNPISTMVKSVDVSERKVDNNGVLRSSRVLATEWSIPTWATSLIGLQNPSFAYEYSEVNPKEKTMLLKSVNRNCTNFVSIDETLLYKPHPEDPQKTLLEQSSVITVRGIPLVNYFEGMLASMINTHAKKGREAMEHVIGNIKRECEEFSHKLSAEYVELSEKLSTDYQELSQNVRQGMDELRRGLEEMDMGSRNVLNLDR